MIIHVISRHVRHAIGQEQEIVELDVREDVVFIDMLKKIPVFHTEDGEYFPLVTLETLGLWLKPHGFDAMDTVNLVNVSRIDHIDRDAQRVRFAGGKWTTISRPNIAKYAHLIKS